MTTKTHTQPRILRTYELITKGVPPKKGDAVVIAAANTLQSLAVAAPGRPGLQEMLSKASQTARAFTPRRPTFSQEVA
jgi:hypothetical protein